MSGKYLREYFGDTDFYTPCLGLARSSLPVYSEYIHIHAKLFFNVLNKFNLEFYVFAGTGVGYVRNKSNIPWVEDYDILIFEKDIKLFEKFIIPDLKKYGFILKRPWRKSGWYVLSDREKKHFQCDVFYSKVCKNNIVRNLNGWGLYHKKNISYDIVSPPRTLKIDDLELPFFNKVEEDILIEYGDVINNVCIHINHKNKKTINQNFNIVYNEFYELLENPKNNTLKYILTNKEYKYQNKCILNSDINFTSIFDILNYISQNNVKDLHIVDQKFLQYCLSIKYYFKEIKIIFYLLEDIDKSNLIFLNYIDFVKCRKDLSIKYEEDKLIYVKNKPTFLPINIITFGTYDLFHDGHYNILKRAKSLGDKLIVGVSSDELNNKKGKSSINSLQTRIKDVEKTGFVNYCFIEESLDKKDEYINTHQADILIMGDDWKNKFDWVSCPCIYLPRTPGISTTELKKNYN